MFTRSSFELKVGIFIFIGILILSIIVLSVGNFYGIKKGYTVTMLFSFANGISIGAPVRYAGVEVGEVKNIKVYFDEKEKKPIVKILVWVSQNTLINEDARATINTLGLLGEKYLEITPGTKEKRLLGKGESLRGYDPVSTEELTRETRETLAKMDRMIESINNVVGDEHSRESIKNILSNLESISVGLEEGSGTIGRFLKDDKLYNDIDEMILDIKKNPWKLLYRPKESKRKKKR